jgi:paraquat-inducible protein B
LPTVNGTSQELESGIARIIKKVNDLPLQETVLQANADLRDLHGTLSALNAQLLPRANDALSALHTTLDSAGRTLDDDSPLRQSLTDTLSETRNTLEAVRELAGYLDRHPEALLRGRRPQSVPKSRATPVREGNP